MTLTFKTRQFIDYKVPRTKDCALIDTDKWITPGDNLLQGYKINGKLVKTCITEVIDTNLCSPEFKDLVKPTDVILMSNVAAEVAPLRSYKRDDTNKNYFDLPIQQVHGIFRNGIVEYKNLEILTDKILIRKIEDTQESLLLLSDSNAMIGEVLRVGLSMQNVAVGDIILIKDNISTPIPFGDKQYFTLEEKMVVGIFEDSLSIENVRFINDSILMQPYTGTKILNSDLLELPKISYEDLDFSDVCNRDLFQIKYLDEELKDLETGDVILTNRDFTNYVFYGMEKYFIINDYKSIAAKIRRV